MRRAKEHVIWAPLYPACIPLTPQSYHSAIRNCGGRIAEVGDKGLSENSSNDLAEGLKLQAISWSDLLTFLTLLLRAASLPSTTFHRSTVPVLSPLCAFLLAAPPHYHT